MTILHDVYASSIPSTFEETEQQRLDLLEDIDKAQAPSLLRKFRTHLVSRRALKLAQRQEMYPAQSEDLLHRAVAVNPKIEQKAHDVLDQIYAEDHPELAVSYIDELPPAKAVAHLALEKTVELSLDLNHYDDTPTVPIPIILQAAVGTINNEQIEHIPESKLRMEAAWNHRAEQMQDQKEARIENATDEEKSEEDDATKLSPEQMKALLLDDDEIDELIDQAKKIAA
ncbi:MAG: hypothetical protein JWN75_575 [Candidatus Saccharibacteria bacterium]|nr:hypothetical protein [Candidatus Saccharibacteria bacterium]